MQPAQPIKIYQFPKLWGLPNISPFCMKLETYLRLADLPYEIIKGDHVFRAPKGKLPFIDDGGQIISDSSLIITHLKQRYGDPLDQHLSDADKAIAHTFQRLFEESLYWPALYSRWLDNRNWPNLKQLVFGQLPPLVRNVVPMLVQRKLRRDAVGQGIGRHAPADIYDMGCRDLEAIATFLGDKPFFMGDRPCILDTTAFGFLANLLWVPVVSPIADQARQHPNLDAYCRRMWALCFADQPLPAGAN
ncbi:glutathione S-transferase family protein [Chitinivorax sp. B]|uniref:glutathione S-transferase family protein n=1 Tax=Chitinivorax sp. B TaxID=2502235 RepID=UPI0010F4B9A6|nr:glutathione S-transferase family protein [Chitinivorax sp. B]